MLTLPIKKKWFDMIKSGEKKEEYREIKPYWTKRFYNLKTYICGYSVTYEGKVIFKNGYSKESPQIECSVVITKGYGKKEWGAEPNKLYYVLKILSVEEL